MWCLAQDYQRNQVIYLLLWTVGENYRTLDDGAFRFVASNFIKAAFCLAIWRVWPRLWEDQSFCKSFGDERPLNDDLPPVEEALQTRSNSAIHSRRTLTPPPFGGVAFMLTIVFIAMVYALSAHMVCSLTHPICPVVEPAFHRISWF